MEINQPEEKRRLTRRQTASLILAGVGLILLITGLLMMRGPAAPPEVGVELSSQSEANTGTWSLSQIRQDYPVGKLVVTTDHSHASWLVWRLGTTAPGRRGSVFRSVITYQTEAASK